jgi:hypothetical protein
MKKLQIFGFAVLLLLCCIGCSKPVVKLSNIGELREKYFSMSELYSADFIGVCYAGTKNGYDYLLFEHSISSDIVVQVPVGFLKLSGRKKLRAFDQGEPISVLMNNEDYTRVFGDISQSSGEISK